MRIGVYFGSFSPVHQGHVTIAKETISQKLVDRLLIVPTGNYWDKNDLLDIKDRIRMWQFFENDKIIIDQTHNEIPKTYQLIRQLKKENPHDCFSLILGGDSLLRFNEWANYEELLTYPFIIVKRDDIAEKEINQLMQNFHKSNYTILNLPLQDVSSTYIRNNLDDYEKIKDQLDRRVYDYLHELKKRSV